MTYTVTATVTATYPMVADNLCAAIEGGSNYWLNRVEPPFENYKAYSEITSFGPEMIPRRFFADEDTTAYVFNHTAIEDGLNTMAAEYPTHWNDLFTENGDATTGDVMLQCILFGELVYG